LLRDRRCALREFRVRNDHDRLYLAGRRLHGDGCGVDLGTTTPSA
jgi:hypothetical protein